MKNFLAWLVLLPFVLWLMVIALIVAPFFLPLIAIIWSVKTIQGSYEDEQ